MPILSNNSNFMARLNECADKCTTMQVDFTDICIVVQQDTVTLGFMYNDIELYRYQFEKPLLEEFTAKISLGGTLQI